MLGRTPPPPPLPVAAQVHPLELLSAFRKSLQLQLQTLQDDINKQLDELQTSVEYQRSTGLQVLDAVQTALAPAMPRLAAFQESSTNMFASAAAWAVDSFRAKGKGKGALNKGAQKGKAKKPAEDVESEDEEDEDSDEDEDEPKVKVRWQGKAGGKSKSKEKTGGGKQGGTFNSFMQAAKGSGKGWPGGGAGVKPAAAVPLQGFTATAEQPAAMPDSIQGAEGMRAAALMSSGLAAVGLGAKAASDAAAAKLVPQQAEPTQDDGSGLIGGDAAKSAMSALAQTAEGVKVSALVSSGLEAVGLGAGVATAESTAAYPEGQGPVTATELPASTAGDAAKTAMAALTQTAGGIKASALISSGLAAAGLGGGTTGDSSGPPDSQLAATDPLVASDPSAGDAAKEAKSALVQTAEGIKASALVGSDLAAAGLGTAAATGDTSAASAASPVADSPEQVQTSNAGMPAVPETELLSTAAS